MAGELSGYDWLLNKCVDLDQANHAAHLDDDLYDPECFHCQNGEGGIIPPPDLEGIPMTASAAEGEMVVADPDGG